MKQGSPFWRIRKLVKFGWRPRKWADGRGYLQRKVKAVIQGSSRFCRYWDGKERLSSCFRCQRRFNWLSVQYEVDEEEERGRRKLKKDAASVPTVEKTQPRKDAGRAKRPWKKISSHREHYQKRSGTSCPDNKRNLFDERARITSEISLPGRFLVLVPGGSKIGVSRKIESGARENVWSSLPRNTVLKGSVSLSHCAEGKGEDEIANEVRDLTTEYDELMKKADSLPAPAFIHKEMGMTSGYKGSFERRCRRSRGRFKDHYEEIRKYLANTSQVLWQGKSIYWKRADIRSLWDWKRDRKYFNARLAQKRRIPRVRPHRGIVGDRCEQRQVCGKISQDETILNTNIEAARKLHVSSVSVTSGHHCYRFYRHCIISSSPESRRFLCWRP